MELLLKINSGKLELYPNPVIDIATIASEYTQNEAFQISGIDGRIVCSGTIKNRQEKLDLSSLSPGLYLLLVGTKEGRKTIKFIKE